MGSCGGRQKGGREGEGEEGRREASEEGGQIYRERIALSSAWGRGSCLADPDGAKQHGLYYSSWYILLPQVTSVATLSCRS